MHSQNSRVNLRVHDDIFRVEGLVREKVNLLRHGPAEPWSSNEAKTAFEPTTPIANPSKQKAPNPKPAT